MARLYAFVFPEPAPVAASPPWRDVFHRTLARVLDAIVISRTHKADSVIAELAREHSAVADFARREGVLLRLPVADARPAPAADLVSCL
jgi:hypothetical protein